MKRFEKLTASLFSPLRPRRKTPQDSHSLPHAVWSPDGGTFLYKKNTIIRENNTHKMSFEGQVEKIWTMGFCIEQTILMFAEKKKKKHTYKHKLPINL